MVGLGSVNFGGTLNVTNLLTISWPPDHLGCRMETKAISLAAINTWFMLNDSISTNQIFVRINLAQTNVFSV